MSGVYRCQAWRCGYAGVVGQGPLRPVREGLLIAQGDRGPALDKAVELLELVQAERGLDVHHIVLVPRRDDLVVLAAFFAEAVPCLAVHAVEAQKRNVGGELLVPRCHAPALSGGHVLVGVEAEDLDIAEAADAPALILRADGVRRVLDHAQVVLFRDRVERIEVNGQSRKVHRHDGARALRDRFLDLRHIHVVGAGLHVHEDRFAAGEHDGVQGRGKGHGSGDHFVARLQVQRNKHQVQARRGRREGKNVRRAEVGLQVLLELLDPWPGGDPARLQAGHHFIDGVLADGRP